MNKVVSIEDIVPLIKEQLNYNGTVRFTPKGNSMLPTLRNNKDSVTLKSPVFPLKKYDIAFYVRDNGQYVLHRIVDIPKDGTYTMRGDNQFVNEKGITQEQIIGIVEQFSRKGKEYSGTENFYKLYCVVWCKTVKIRKWLRKLRHIAGKIKRKLLGTVR